MFTLWSYRCFKYQNTLTLRRFRWILLSTLRIFSALGRWRCDFARCYITIQSDLDSVYLFSYKISMTSVKVAEFVLDVWNHFIHGHCLFGMKQINKKLEQAVLIRFYNVEVRTGYIYYEDVDSVWRLWKETFNQCFKIGGSMSRSKATPLCDNMEIWK